MVVPIGRPHCAHSLPLFHGPGLQLPALLPDSDCFLRSHVSSWVAHVLLGAQVPGSAEGLGAGVLGSVPWVSSPFCQCPASPGCFSVARGPMCFRTTASPSSSPWARGHSISRKLPRYWGIQQMSICPPPARPLGPRAWCPLLPQWSVSPILVPGLHLRPPVWRPPYAGLPEPSHRLCGCPACL